MKKLSTIFVVLVFQAVFLAIFASPSQGAAIGIFLGQPTGITLRIGLGGEQSVEAKVAWDLASSGKTSPSFSFQANWLLELPGILIIKDEAFPLYFGVGAQLDVGSDLLVGFRVPGGIIYRFSQIPLELCIEAAIGMSVFPSTGLLASGGLGIRYRFP